MSTPIETNTEELQEILQTVYNLPLAGGSGKVSWDCVIEASGTYLEGGKINFTVVSGSLRGVHDKLSAFEKPNVLLRRLNDYDGDFETHYSECIAMSHFFTDYSDSEGLNMYFSFAGKFVRVYADSKADIDGNTLKYFVTETV